MKKILATLLSLMMVVTCAFMITSCNEPQPNTDPEPSYLVGTWKCIEGYYTVSEHTYIFTNTDVSYEIKNNGVFFYGYEGTYTETSTGIYVKYTKKYDFDTKSYVDCSDEAFLTLTKNSDTQIELEGFQYTKQ